MHSIDDIPFGGTVNETPNRIPAVDPALHIYPPSFALRAIQIRIVAPL